MVTRSKCYSLPFSDASTFKPGIIVGGWRGMTSLIENTQAFHGCLFFPLSLWKFSDTNVEKNSIENPHEPLPSFNNCQHFVYFFFSSMLLKRPKFISQDCWLSGFHEIHEPGCPGNSWRGRNCDSHTSYFLPHLHSSGQIYVRIQKPKSV